MHPTKLAHLINDTIEGINRSNLKSMYVLDDVKQVIKTDCNGFPFYNMVSVQTLQTLLMAQIMKASIYED